MHYWCEKYIKIMSEDIRGLLELFPLLLFSEVTFLVAPLIPHNQLLLPRCFVLILCDVIYVFLGFVLIHQCFERCPVLYEVWIVCGEKTIY